MILLLYQITRNIYIMIKIFQLKQSRMKNIQYIIIIVTILFSSCGGSNESPLLPKTSGAAGEVLVITTQGQWKGPIGESYREVLEATEDILPQPEPVFTVVHVPRDGFSKIFHTHRNIILTKVGPEYKEAKILVQKDVWATPQLLLNVVAPDNKAAAALIKEKRDRIFSLLIDAERKRIRQNYKINLDGEIYQMLRKEHHISLVVPSSYEVALDSGNFIWLESKIPDLIQGIFIYYYDYTDTSMFSKDYQIEKRNNLLRKFVPGPDPGSYMTTETIIDPIYSEFMYKEQFYTELKGLWKLEKGFMGGPFVSVSTVDQKRNRIVTVEGFVFAPKFQKRTYLRQMESIIYSLEIL